MYMPLWTLNLLSRPGACSSHMRTHQLLPPLPTGRHGSQALADRYQKEEVEESSTERTRGQSCGRVAKGETRSDRLNAWVWGGVIRWPSVMGSCAS